MLKENLKLCELGDSKGYFNIGVMYYDGNGVKQDYSKSIEYYWKLFKLGHFEIKYIRFVSFFYKILSLLKWIKIIINL